MNEDLDAVRTRAEHAYARWRACNAQLPRDEAMDKECARLKAELDVAARALFAARRPSLTLG